MVDRISTAGNYSAILANLMAAESRQVDAENRVSSQKNGNSLKDFANQAETLTAMKTVDSRITNYQDSNSQIAAKLTTQNTALSATADAATAVRQAITDALANDSADALMQQVQGQFQTAVSSLNAQYNGKYLFAGGQVDTQPVSATQLSDLTSGAPISSFFQNDSFKVQAKLDDSTTVTTGQLASNLGTNMMTSFQALQAFDTGGSGPLSGPLTAAQRTFLQNQLASWTTIGTDLTTATAQNGIIQNQVDTVGTRLVDQQNTLTGMIGNITDADMAKAATDLANANLSVQATAQVLQVMQSSSLLNLLK
ncbi:MAG: flagellin [Phenylobacterium sp.]|uniref:flagellin n=1 Tax=Phenylobacterium sp. TaxID=1871053 RepID=UPI00261CB8C7|nr:flagellin [Phenylobacterium sp.]MDB5465145.1 flagellin [Phenylobacterium sp.]MDB5497339.1 flagellin [Phenylobacterium sp.]